MGATADSMTWEQILKMPGKAETLSADSQRQQDQYNQIFSDYLDNLEFPHTRAYLDYMDQKVRDLLPVSSLGWCAELCCGWGEGFGVLASQIDRGVGVDISSHMLQYARKRFAKDGDKFRFVQGDACQLPIQDGCLDSVLLFGGIHHINNRSQLFQEVHRVLKPGGFLIFREPCDDFWLWRGLRSIVYRFSPLLDHQTERPLRFEETVPLLNQTGFQTIQYKRYTFLGFCLFMNSDVMKINKIFRKVPGIQSIVRVFTRFDDWVTERSWGKNLGCQVIGIFEKKV
jgi:ubiquinone/menaquinone biosynthesis C-methylase UbiE